MKILFISTMNLCGGFVWWRCVAHIASGPFQCIQIRLVDVHTHTVQDEILTFIELV